MDKGLKQEVGKKLDGHLEKLSSGGGHAAVQHFDGAWGGHGSLMLCSPYRNCRRYRHHRCRERRPCCHLRASSSTRAPKLGADQWRYNLDVPARRSDRLLLVHSGRVEEWRSESRGAAVGVRER